jgi:phosphate:Na+ symporter
VTPFNALIFGLGLFFIGLHLVGDNLKALSGGRFRDGIARTTLRPLPRMALGLASGALMQSATAVTFICVSLVSAELLTANAASLVIVWSNVGLTVLAFVATLNIHPVVAFLIGGAGIVMGVVRIRSWQTVASVLIGIGLILFGLEQMSAGAAPLKNEPWFRDAIDLAVSSAPLAFLSGILIASILQSNTGATMMLITLANAGALDIKDAALMIYGTNLGAIALRAVLATGMKGQSLRLVRMEDFFCLFSGGTLFGLYFLEQSGIPLILALSGEISTDIDTRLALLFLFSNLIPALAISPFIPLVTQMLGKIWPGEPPDVPGAPKFLQKQALNDPATALALIRKELARLLGRVTGEPGAPRDASEDSGPSANFETLSNAIERFASQLASRATMNEADALKLHSLRSALSGIRHLEEAARFFVARASVPGVIAPEKRARLKKTLHDLLAAMARAMDTDDMAAITTIRDHTKTQGDFVAEIRQQLGAQPGGTLDQSALLVDFEFVAWALHHLTKILVRQEAPRPLS